MCWHHVVTIDIWNILYLMNSKRKSNRSIKIPQLVRYFGITFVSHWRTMFPVTRKWGRTNFRLSARCKISLMIRADCKNLPLIWKFKRMEGNKNKRRTMDVSFLESIFISFCWFSLFVATYSNKSMFNVYN